MTQQQLDQFHSAAEQAKANVVSSSAIVDRLKTLVSFERITAPFDGVVTARNYDTGALISASNTAPGQELYDLAEDDRLRVFVSVPQDYAPLVRYGQPVELLLEQNYPGHRFHGAVARSAGTLDPVTRTLRTELDFRNGDPARRIFPGMYGKAVFRFSRDRPALTVPTSALLFKSSGKRVAVVGEDGKVHMRSIVLGNDFGTKIEVLSGLPGDEWIVANPDEQLAEGIPSRPFTTERRARNPAPPRSPRLPAPPNRDERIPQAPGRGRIGWAFLLLSLPGAGFLAGCVNQAQEVQAYRDVLDAHEPKPKPLAPGEKLTLPRALALANADNEQIASQGETYLQALISKNRAVAVFLPTVSFQPNYTIEQAPGGTAAPASPGAPATSAASVAATGGGYVQRGDTLRRLQAPVVGNHEPLLQQRAQPEGGRDGRH